MEIGKIFSAIKVQLIIALFLVIIGFILAYFNLSDTLSVLKYANYSDATNIQNNQVIYSFASIIISIINLIVLVWAGHSAAKATSGGVKEGAIGGIIITVISAILSAILTLIFIFPLTASLQSGLFSLILGLSALLAPFVVAIPGAILGAIGGYIGRAK